jgi:hypothetical protein
VVDSYPLLEEGLSRRIKLWNATSRVRRDGGGQTLVSVFRRLKLFEAEPSSSNHRRDSMSRMLRSVSPRGFRNHDQSGRK